MPEVNFEWVREQLDAAKVRVGSGKAIIKLLEEWNDMKLSSQMSEETLTFFAKLARGEAVLEQSEEETWIPCQPGQITVGDEVRVLANAFSDPKLGPTHNGRRGRVVAIRYGDVIFKSTDGKEPVLDGAHYSPYKLEKRVS